MLDSNQSWNLTSLFVIVGLDPTIHEFSDNLSQRRYFDEWIPAYAGMTKKIIGFFRAIVRFPPAVW